MDNVIEIIALLRKRLEFELQMLNGGGQQLRRSGSWRLPSGAALHKYKTPTLLDRVVLAVSQHGSTMHGANSE